MLSEASVKVFLDGGWSPIASQYIEVELAPGESRDFVFLLGYIENEQEEKFEAKKVINKKKAHELIDRLNTHEGSIGNLCNDRIQELMDKTLDGFHFERVEEAERRLLNVE